MEAKKSNNAPKIIQRWLVRTFFGTCLTAAILFIPAGTARWGMGWFYTISLLIIGLATAVILEPDLLSERMVRTFPNQKPWDIHLFRFYGLITGFLVPLVSGLEFRFDWKPNLPGWLVGAGIIVFGIGWLFGLWAMHTNKYFSKAARIQEDRSQTIVTSGPYQWIRHPGYLSGIFTLLTTPLILESTWGIIPAILGASALVIRTALEDKMLLQELENYSVYAHRVRWRLIPGLW